MEPFDITFHLRPQFSEQTVFQNDALVFGRQYFRLHLLEFRSDETFRVRQCLLAAVFEFFGIKIHRIHFRYFDEIAEYLIETDLDIFNAGPFSFSFQIFIQVASRIILYISEPGQLFIIFRFEYITVTHSFRRRIQQTVI